MKIYLVRHSVPEDPGDDEEDPDPSLTKEGIEIVEALADWMLDKDEVPNVMYASPTARTQETAEILREKFGLPKVKTDVSIGPHASIRGLVKSILADESQTRVMIVSHHESIEHGLRVLNLEPWIHLDEFAQGEMRIMKVDREDATWKEHRRVEPSKFGATDHY